MEKKSKLNNLFDKPKKTAPTKPKFESLANKQIMIDSGKNKVVYTNQINQVVNGLRNSGNSCYSNVIIQSLVNCNEFVLDLEKVVNQIQYFDQKIIDSEYPATYNLYGALYNYLSKNSSLTVNHLNTLKALFDPFGQQNDAHEFLVYLLNKSHDELINLSKLNDGLKQDECKAECIEEEIKKINIVDECDDDWEEIKKDGKRMKLTNNLKDFPRTLITNFFGGLLKHETKRSGKSVSDSNIEPFFAITIDSKWPEIEKNLECYFNRRIVDGNDSLMLKSYFEHLPYILIIQIKSFYYDKIKKQVFKDTLSITYDSTLQINEDWLSPSQQSTNKSVQYELVSLIVHQGKKTTEGHYVCFCKKGNSWLYFDDSKLISVTEKDVLAHRPYLLFYKIIKN